MSKHVPARRGLTGGLVAALVAAPLVVGLSSAPAHANPAGTGLVISEVYGGGGNAGAPFNADFIELYNPTTGPLSLSGLSVQYRSATGGPGGPPVALSGSLAAQTHYLVQMSAPGANGVALPTPDVVANPAINMAAGGGRVGLVNGTTQFEQTGNVAGSTAFVDFVGAAGAATFEGAVGPAGTAASSLNRSAAGLDSDNNSTDFTLQAPSPANSGGGSDPDPEPDPEPGAVVTIPEIQGTGAASPLVGEVVITEGVVTAVYPTGGFFGFYLQTPGTGGPTDPATRTASDAVFVRQGAGTVGVQVGQTVRVQGTVGEFAGATQVNIADAAAVTQLPAAAPVTASTTAAWPATDVLKERLEAMLYRPSGAFTVSNNFTTNQFGEIGLAVGETPLLQPTEGAEAGTPRAAEIAADNAARAIVLDDGASTNFIATSTSAATCGTRPTPCLVNGSQTPPYISNSNPIRIGATGTFDEDVILTQGGSPTAPSYRFQPTATVVGDGSGAAPINVENTRTPAPIDSMVDPDGEAEVKVASFNVLNYFTTLGDADSDGVGDGGCAAFRDRTGNGNNVSGGCDQRGAWDPADLNRQQTKIVAAINALDADVVGLMEIESSDALGETADEATNTLVAALNTAAGAGTWAANPSSAELPPAATRDVITNAIIYKPGTVTRLGASRALGNLSDDGQAFGNAREPLAQAFTPVDGGDPFMVVVNHFKSKGSAGPFPGDTDQGDGQGASNQSRVRQATALAAWVPSVQGDVEDVLLLGDFNSYTQEDPMQVLYDQGYTNLAPEGDYSYSFAGLSGSLDHIIANGAIADRVTGSDVWNINGGEPVALEYSRFNYHSTDFHTDGPFRSSDHDPIVVGLSSGSDPEPEGPLELNLLNINDFHGRIDANTTRFATTLERLRAEGGEDETLFLSAGDNIGASLFASSIQDDDPTIDVLNALDLRASAVGNHELDQGFADLRDDVIPSADFSYLAANIYREGTTTPVLDEYDIFEVDGVRVAVVGAITEETPALVSPGGIANLEFGDPVEAVNRVAERLSDGISTRVNEEADVIVAEFHEGAAAGIRDGSTLEEEVAAGGVFASIVNDTSSEVDAIFTGHTHKQYAWDGPVPGGEAGETRPILQTGSYGENVGQIVLSVDRETGQVDSYTQRNVARSTTEDLSFPRVAEVKRITDAALAFAAEVGNRPVGRISADITTAFTGTSRDDRAAESTLGGLVANALRDGVSDFAEPDLGLTNPGGLRAELLFAGNTTSNPANTNGVVTFAEANAVLPFNNTVALVDLTGAQLKAVLEQQWQTNPDGTVPSRPYLQLGLSSNVSVIADEAAAAGSRILSVRIDGQEIDPEATYTVSTLSFLAQGGDNFRAFTDATFVDTGLLDAQLWRDYLASESETAPIAPDFARQQVFVDGLGASLPAGETSSFQLGVPVGDTTAPITGTTLNLTSLGSPANTTLTATLLDGGTETDLGSFPVTAGIAMVEIDVPEVGEGAVVRMVAEPSGTAVTVPVQAGAGDPDPVITTLDARTTYPQVKVGSGSFNVVATVTASGGYEPTGTVTVRRGGKIFGTAAVVDGQVRISAGPFTSVGELELTVEYSGDEVAPAATDVVPITVTKAKPVLRVAAASPVRSGARPSVFARLSVEGLTVNGRVEFSYGGQSVIRRLDDERAEVRLPRVVRDTRVTVRYLGNSALNPVQTSTTVRVQR